MVWEMMVAKLVRKPTCGKVDCRDVISMLPLQVKLFGVYFMHLCDDVIALCFIDGNRSSSRSSIMNRGTEKVKGSGDNRVSTCVAASAGLPLGWTPSDPSFPHPHTRTRAYTHTGRMGQHHPVFVLHHPIRVSSWHQATACPAARITATWSAGSGFY